MPFKHFNCVETKRKNLLSLSVSSGEITEHHPTNGSIYVTRTYSDKTCCQTMTLDGFDPLYSHEARSHDFQRWTDIEMPRRITCFAQETQPSADAEHSVALCSLLCATCSKRMHMVSCDCGAETCSFHISTSLMHRRQRREALRKCSTASTRDDLRRVQLNGLETEEFFQLCCLRNAKNSELQ